MFGGAIEDAIKKQVDVIDKKYANVGGLAVAMTFQDFVAVEFGRVLFQTGSQKPVNALAAEAYSLADAFVREKKTRNTTGANNAAVGK